MKVVDTKEYVSMLRELVENGQEVQIIICGNSMVPFLVHKRDVAYFKKPDRDLRSGDIVFYQRKNGQYVMHRIWKVKPEGYYIVGDAQDVIEGPVKEEQIFGLITRVQRKGKWIEKGNFYWEFFEHIWIHLIPFRKGLMKCWHRVGSCLLHKKLL